MLFELKLYLGSFRYVSQSIGETFESHLYVKDTSGDAYRTEAIICICEPVSAGA